jgi:hypothetical protein
MHSYLKLSTLQSSLVESELDQNSLTRYRLGLQLIMPTKAVF